MFRTCKIKNSYRIKAKRLVDKSINECAERHPDERRLPYFEIVAEQVLRDPRYLSLDIQQQGAFWRLVVHVLSIDSGITVRHPGYIAKRLGIPIAEWEQLEAQLLSSGLLTLVDDGNCLMQHEYREQYLQTLEANNAKRRY